MINYLIMMSVTISLLVGGLFLKIKKRKYSPSNKILFCKLKKEYINNATTEDLKDLICFFIIELLRRKEIKK